MIKIIECPFCGNEPDPHPCCIGLKTNPRYQLYCPCCEYWGPVGHSPQLAIEAWNTRHDNKPNGGNHEREPREI